MTSIPLSRSCRAGTATFTVNGNTRSLRHRHPHQHRHGSRAGRRDRPDPATTARPIPTRSPQSPICRSPRPTASPTSSPGRARPTPSWSATPAPRRHGGQRDRRLPHGHVRDWTATASTGSSVAASAGSGDISDHRHAPAGRDGDLHRRCQREPLRYGNPHEHRHGGRPRGRHRRRPADNSATDTDTIGPAPPSGAAILVVTNGSDAVSDAGVSAIQSLGDYTVTVARDPAQIAAELTPASLADYRAVVFLDTGGDRGLTAARKPPSRTYFHKGGGFVGIGSAIETRPELAVPDRHPRHALVRPAPRSRPARSRSPTASTTRRRTCRSTGTARTLGTTSRPTSAASRTCSPRSSRIRSARSRRDTLDGIAGGTMGADHPVSCCKDYQGGRSFYTGSATRRRASTTTAFKTHLRARSTGPPARPTRTTATAARPCSRTTSRSRSAPRRT